MAWSLDGALTSPFATLNFFLATPNIPNKGQSPTCVPSTKNIVSIQQNNQVLEKSLGGHTNQVAHKAYRRAMDKVMQRLGIEVVTHSQAP
jgi:hypothetical protein